MASISTGSGGSGGKRAVDHEIPLVPFIDLLLCCVMFLLVTAVWNQLAEMQASLRSPSSEQGPTDPTPPIASFVVHLGQRAITVAGDVGDRIEIPHLHEGEPDLAALVANLSPRRVPGADLVVVADDGTHYETVIATMDAVASAGFDRVTMGDGL